jgi:hypothetical protein
MLKDVVTPQTKRIRMLLDAFVDGVGRSFENRSFKFSSKTGQRMDWGPPHNGFAHRNDQKIHFNFDEIHFCLLKVDYFGK